MIRGTEAVVFPTEFGVVGSAISFEGSFARSMRSIARAGAEVVAVSTNTSSFGISAASDQAIGMVKVNAAGIGLNTAYASITGKSTFVSADGSNGRTTDLLERTILYGSLQFTGGGRTIWVRFGDWMAFLAMAGLVAAIALPGTRAKEEAQFSIFGS
jgi:apolipoprotein N-acyltransferase